MSSIQIPPWPIKWMSRAAMLKLYPPPKDSLLDEYGMPDPKKIISKALKENFKHKLVGPK